MLRRAALALAGLFLLVFPAKPAVLAQNAVYLEGGGPGILLSLNYEYRFAPSASLRVGFGFALLGYTVPLTLNLFLPLAGAHAFEIGVGVAPGEFAVPLPGVPPKHVVLLTAHVGYRYHPLTGGLLVRLGFTPFLVLTDGPRFQLWGGISVGYVF